MDPNSTVSHNVMSSSLAIAENINDEPNTASVGNMSSLNGTSSETAGPSSSAVKIESSVHLLQDPKLKEVILSDVGVEVLLARLKSSYQTATNVAQYIKKRATLESERVQDLKRLSKATHETIRRSEYRQGTFARQFDEALTFDERIFDSSLAFVTALHSMHDELVDLSKSSHKTRKILKDSCFRNEKNLMDAEANAEKAKTRYYGLCEDMEKLKDPSKTKFFKAKNTQQQEQELQTKINLAEQEYYSKVESAKTLRKDLVDTLRPHSAKDLENLIFECDSGISYQLQKLATLNETLLLQQGYIVRPLKSTGSATSPPSLKQVMAKIDNELDFYNDILQSKNSKPLNRPEVNFIKHPYMVAFDKVPSANIHSTISAPRNTTSSNAQFNALKTPSQQSPVVASPHTKSSSVSSSSAIVPNTVASPTYQRNTNGALYPEESSVSSSIPTAPITASIASKTSLSGPALPYPEVGANNDAASGSIRSAVSKFDPASRSSSQSPRHDIYESSRTTPSVYKTNGSLRDLPNKVPVLPAGPYVPTFGSTLDELIEFENIPVATPIPRVVSKCVGAITRFGMAIEDVYREDGDPDQVEILRRMFDESSEKVDLLNPQKYHISDIHAVSGVLKLYFQELPDPLLTRALHSQFTQAASIDSDNSRREAIHIVVNDLPDANYSVLKFMALHLYRVAQHEVQNRMPVPTLGSVWGPVFMFSETQDVNEHVLQSRVVETILYFCDEIFEYTPDFYECVGSDM